MLMVGFGKEKRRKRYIVIQMPIKEKEKNTSAPSAIMLVKYSIL